MSTIKKITKAVFPMAGLGTRFLPVTKVLPKEILPIINKPIIQFAVEEAVAAGIKEMIFITSATKTIIENYFDCNYELETVLEQRDQPLLLSMIKDILPKDVTCVFVHQSRPLGLGHAVLCAKRLIGNESFAVLLADNLIEEAPQGCLKNMISLYETTGANFVALNPVPREHVNKYGIVAMGENKNGYATIKSLVEKPNIKDAPSNLSIVGRYLLSSQIFALLEQTPPDCRGEIQLTDAIASLIQEEQVLGYFLQGQCFDCGSKYGYVQATVEQALKDPELKLHLENYLSSLLATKQKDHGIQDS